MTTRRIGNQRTFELPNHRLDKDAMQQVISDPQETLTYLLGGLVGEDKVSGVMSTATFTSSGAVVSFPDPFVLCYGHTLDGRAVGKVIRYNPLDEAQGAVSVDLTANIGAETAVLFRWVGADTNEETQAYWDGAESTDAVTTTNSEAVEFAGRAFSEWLAQSNASYSSENGWFIFGRVKEWSGSTPAFGFIDPLDSIGLRATSNNLAVQPSIYDITPDGFPLRADAPRGWVRVLKALINQVYMFHDSLSEIDTDGVAAYPILPDDDDATQGWYRHPAYGARQLRHFINEVWTTEPRVLYQATLLWTIDVPSLNYVSSFSGITASVEAAAWGSSLKAVVTVDGATLPAGVSVRSVLVVANWDGGASYPLALPSDGMSGRLAVHAFYATASSLPFAGNGSSHLVFDVGCVTPSADSNPQALVAYYGSAVLITIYGTYAARTEDYVFITRD